MITDGFQGHVHSCVSQSAAEKGITEEGPAQTGATAATTQSRICDLCVRRVAWGASA
jgi:hypothetical protein